MRVTLKQLEVFVETAKAGNVSHAAKRMYLSQSACSMALATLEDQLEGSVFDRHGKHLILNERGRSLLPKAITIISQIKELKDMMLENKKENLSGQLVVGASKTIGNYVLPQLIFDFTRIHQNTQIKLTIDTTEAVLAKLLSFTIDIALIEGNCYSSRVNSYPWKKDELLVLASPNDPLSKKRKLTLSDIANARWLLREGSSRTRMKLEASIGGKIQPFLELDDIEAIKQATEAGLGISCLSSSIVKDAIKTNQLVVLKTPFLNLVCQFYIVLHKDKYQSTLIAEFLKKCA